MNTHMSAIDALTTRASNGKLGDPEPDAETLRLCFEAAARAPDHGTLRPWRVRIVRGEARKQLGELMARTLARKQPQASHEELENMRGKALRAPLILVVGVQLTEPSKIPVIEQTLAAGAAAYAMLLTLHARGFAAVWRTGDAAYDDETKRAFGLRQEDALIGFIYAGTAKQPAPALLRPAPSDFVQEWTG
ncbi:MAG TPA: nitroreductase [Polyangiales bacterium]